MRLNGLFSHFFLLFSADHFQFAIKSVPAILHSLALPDLPKMLGKILILNEWKEALK